MIKTAEELKKLKEEAFRALGCLYLQIDESIAKDIAKRVSALINGLETNLALTEMVSQRLCNQLSKSLDEIIEEIRKSSFDELIENTKDSE